MKDTLGEAIAKAIDATVPKPSCSKCGGIEMSRWLYVAHDYRRELPHCPECGVVITCDGEPVGVYQADGSPWAVILVDEDGSYSKPMGQPREKPLGPWRGPSTT